MRIVRGLGVALLIGIVWFVGMVGTTAAFSFGWGPGLGLLILFWGVYLATQVYRLERLSHCGLAALTGYATGLLREVDRFTTPEHARWLTLLPKEWVGRAGLGFFFIFVAFLPWLASRLAARIAGK